MAGLLSMSFVPSVPILFNTLASSGSAVTLPLLIALGVPAPVANGTNRIGVLVGAASAGAAFHRARVMDWRNGLILTVPAVIGTGVGGPSRA